MSVKEVSRLEGVQKVLSKQLSVSQASSVLGVSPRQVKRLTRLYRQEGAQGLVSKHRGKSSNNKIASARKSMVMQVVISKYADFGPTLASEKLREVDGLLISKETLRIWMQETGLWATKRRKIARVYQSRARRSCIGELVQIDGSHHDWFEGRRDKCCLLVFIDDATGSLQQLRFEEAETTFGYFAATRDYINAHGRPLAFYSDKHGVFRVNISESITGNATTQFGRAMNTLDIELICANTPQAKGRVERANGTLQDRLVKELRLQKIDDIETANAFLPMFIADYNRRFAVEPKSSANAHRKVRPTEAAMDLIFSLQESRKLSKNLELSYKNEIFQIKCATPGYTMRHAAVTVCETREGVIHLIYKRRVLDYVRHQKNKRPTQVVDSKSLNKVVDKLAKHDGRSAGHKPAPNHPWGQRATRLATPGIPLERAAVTHNSTGATV